MVRVEWKRKGWRGWSGRGRGGEGEGRVAGKVRQFLPQEDGDVWGSVLTWSGCGK